MVAPYLLASCNPRGRLLECEPCRRFNQANASIWSIKKGGSMPLRSKPATGFSTAGKPSRMTTSSDSLTEPRFVFPEGRP